MTKVVPPDAEYVRRRVDEALAEDGAHEDCTVAWLGLQRKEVEAAIHVRDDGVIAGLDIARAAFTAQDTATRFVARANDGERVKAGAPIAEVFGSAGGVLSAERVALNFLQRLSGIATLTARFVEAVRGTGVRILDTRKTTPLLRSLERYAVRVGGGVNHRYNLSDMILIKENHVRSFGGVEAVVDTLLRLDSDREVEIEVDTIDFLRRLLGCPIDRVMLDNFSPAEVRRAVHEIAEYRKDHPGFKPRVEVSGGVNLDNITLYAIAGVDDISIGGLTHSASALDISLGVK